MMPKGRHRIMTGYMRKVGENWFGCYTVSQLDPRETNIRLFLRSRHGEEAAGLAGAAAGCNGDVRIRPSLRASPTGFSRPGPDWRDTADAPGCYPGHSSRHGISSVMSAMPGACRLLRQTRRALYRRRRPIIPRSDGGKTRGPSRRAATFRLGQPRSPRSSRRCGSSAIWKCAAQTVAMAPLAGASGLLVGISTMMIRDKPLGIR